VESGNYLLCRVTAKRTGTQGQHSHTPRQNPYPDPKLNPNPKPYLMWTCWSCWPCTFCSDRLCRPQKMQQKTRESTKTSLIHQTCPNIY